MPAPPDVQAVVLVGVNRDWARPCRTLPVYTFDEQWAVNGDKIDAFDVALSRHSVLLVVTPALSLAATPRITKVAALETARAIRKTKPHVAIVIDDVAHLSNHSLREWASLLCATSLRTPAYAAALFRARTLTKPPSTRALWNGALRIPRSSHGSAPCLPGFRLLARDDAAHSRAAAFLPLSIKARATTPALLLTMVPRAQPIGALLATCNELELHLSADCNATTSFFCDGLAQSGEQLLIRIENLTMLVRHRSSQNGWVADVAPVYALPTPFVRALDVSWFRKYELGQCGRSKIYMPPPSLIQLPIVPAKDAPKEPWIDNRKFADAIDVLTRVGVNKMPGKRKNDSTTSRLRAPPPSEERAGVERDALKRKEAQRCDVARKRSRSGHLSLDSLADPSSSRPWTVRSTLSEDFNPGSSNSLSKDQLSALRQNRHMRLQSMQNARSVALRTTGDTVGGSRGLGRRKSADNERRNPTRSRSAIAPRTTDASILRRLERQDKFFDYNSANRQLPAYRRAEVPPSNCCVPTHGVEFAPDEPDPRDALLVRYEREVGRAKQDHDTAWPLFRSREVLTKMRDAANLLRGDHQAALLKDESSSVRGDTDNSPVNADELDIEQRLKQLFAERDRIDEQIRILQARKPHTIPLLGKGQVVSQ